MIQKVDDILSAVFPLIQLDRFYYLLAGILGRFRRMGSIIRKCAFKFRGKYHITIFEPKHIDFMAIYSFVHNV